MTMNYNDMKTSYKEYCKPKLKKYKNTDVIPTIHSLMSQLERIALGRFEWTGVDGNGIALSRKIEEYLFYSKQCAIVDTNEVGLAVVRLINRGVNIYGEPAGYDMLTANGVKLTPALPRLNPNAEGQIGIDNAIILHDSQLPGRGCIDGMWHWVEKFADAQITMNQQMINQRAPLMGITKDRNEEPYASVQILDIASGLNALIIDKDMRDSVQVLNLNSQFNVDRINAVQHEYISRALNSLGVDSMQSFGKKERMIVDEIESNDESLAMILSDCIKARNDPLINNITAQEYGIKCELAKPFRISTEKENKITYTESVTPAVEKDTNNVSETIDEVME